MINKKLTIKDLCYVGIFTAIISVVSQISIPMPYGVPMTLQTFIIPLAGIILGARKATLATIIYILLGSIGIPVFAGFSSGLGILLGPTGGFIISFPLMAWLAGLGAEKEKHLYLLLGLITGAIANYLVGMLMFSLVTSNSLQTAFIACVLPFIPTAIIKIFLVDILGRKIKKVVYKSGLYIN
ncbi:biotin transporter BioY [Anaerosphaera multitolerans]|uniref:Biotin transporter n=1 Tax=Anaerosphaera multitolerans TaxID=2487351 RepID=A0A437S7L0_9FIRM|nr:biotin transporter BioY [Anaerosphaera multitolerans]RVU54982.1 biotin transporter BioY [Anaerosphaera multitolerans]